MVLSQFIIVLTITAFSKLIAMEEQESPPLRRRLSAVSFCQDPLDLLNRGHRGRGSSLPDDEDTLPTNFTLGCPIRMEQRSIQSPTLGYLYERKTKSRSGINEDAFSVRQSGNTMCITVCDGHGTGSLDMLGRPLQKNLPGSVARHASEHIVTIIETTHNRFHNRDSIIESFQAIDYAYSHHPYKHQGSTMSCVFADNQTVTVAHVGDSPVWIMKTDGTFFRTTDHDARLEQKRIENEGGVVHDNEGTLRIGGHIETARAMGNCGCDGMDPYLEVAKFTDSECKHADHCEYIKLFPAQKLKGLSNVPDVAHFAQRDCSFALIASDGFEKLCVEYEAFLIQEEITCAESSVHHRNRIDTQRILNFIQGCKESDLSAQETIDALIVHITARDGNKHIKFPDDTTIVLMYLT